MDWRCKEADKMAGKKCKAKGGRAQVVSGNKNVIDEAEENKTGDVGRKKGGKVKKKERQTGGKVIGLMTGGGVRLRLDRPGRKSGGGVGANRSPLSTAHSVSGGASGSSNPQDTYHGTPK
jgi:hypothetical protein